MPPKKARAGGNPPILDHKRLAAGERDLLTPRELEVAEWIAAAKTNHQIGAALGCSPRTVKKHVEHILEKLRMESRISIGIWWVELQLNGRSSHHSEQKSDRV